MKINQFECENIIKQILTTVRFILILWCTSVSLWFSLLIEYSSLIGRRIIKIFSDWPEHIHTPFWLVRTLCKLLSDWPEQKQTPLWLDWAYTNSFLIGLSIYKLLSDWWEHYTNSSLIGLNKKKLLSDWPEHTQTLLWLARTYTNSSLIGQNIYKLFFDWQVTQSSPRGQFKAENGSHLVSTPLWSTIEKHFVNSYTVFFILCKEKVHKLIWLLWQCIVILTINTFILQ